MRTKCKRFQEPHDDRRSRIMPTAPLGSDCYYFIPLHNELTNYRDRNGGDVPKLVDVKLSNAAGHACTNDSSELGPLPVG